MDKSEMWWLGEAEQGLPELPIVRPPTPDIVMTEQDVKNRDENRCYQCNDIDPTTPFYALTADVDGYRLEDQILGGKTLREWLRAHNGNFAEENLVDELYDRADLRNEFYLTEDEACDALLWESKRQYVPGSRVESFTAAEILNRLRIEGMEQSDDH